MVKEEAALREETLTGRTGMTENSIQFTAALQELIVILTNLYNIPSWVYMCNSLAVQAHLPILLLILYVRI